MLIMTSLDSNVFMASQARYVPFELCSDVLMLTLPAAVALRPLCAPASCTRIPRMITVKPTLCYGTEPATFTLNPRPKALNHLRFRL